MRILVVEDEVKLARAIQKGLTLQGWVSENSRTASEAIGLLNFESFDLILLDRMLADGSDGFEVCKWMRDNKNTTPILFLSARNEIRDRIEGLNLGADDYLGKPFDMEELYARIRALVRRPQEKIGPVFQIDDLKIDLSAKNVTADNKPIQFSKKEFSLIEFLVSNSGQVLSKEQIISRVWEFDADILPNTVEATVKNIRSKIKKYLPEVQLIETVRGYGYRICESKEKQSV